MSPLRERTPLDSTMIRRGSDAARLSELAAFVSELEHSPLAKIATDLPGLLGLSERKLDLVRQVLRRRLRSATEDERRAFRSAALGPSRDRAADDGVAQMLEAVGA